MGPFVSGDVIWQGELLPANLPVLARGVVNVFKTAGKTLSAADDSTAPEVGVN